MIFLSLRMHSKIHPNIPETKSQIQIVFSLPPKIQLPGQSQVFCQLRLTAVSQSTSKLISNDLYSNTYFLSKPFLRLQRVRARKKE